MRELVPHIDLIPKVIPLKLFLDMVPSSPADANARCVDVLACCLRDDQRRNGRKCCVKVAFGSFYGNVFVFTFANKMNTSYFHTTFLATAFLIVSPRHARTSTQRALTSAGEVGTMSKNNLRGISFGIRPIWGIKSLTSYPLGITLI